MDREHNPQMFMQSILQKKRAIEYNYLIAMGVYQNRTGGIEIVPDI
jgi:hypothetical protein